MKQNNKEIEQYRVTKGLMGSDSSCGNNGAFIINLKKITSVVDVALTVVCSDKMGWEHVSVSLSDRTPIWEEMCFVKNLFWDKSETVIQYHPAKLEYINNHPYCLHLWKKTGNKFELPPLFMV